MTCPQHKPSFLASLRVQFWALCFFLYIYDLPQCLENCSINMYADDTVMFFFFTNFCTPEIARVVQDDLNRVVQWLESSRLILNLNAIWKLAESC